MKKATWDNPNKMHIETGYKLFDKQTNVISYGNVYANTQSSGYIRPYAEVKCNGTTRKPGELMKYPTTHRKLLHKYGNLHSCTTFINQCVAAHDEEERW